MFKIARKEGRDNEVRLGGSADRQTGLKQVVKKPVQSAFPN